MNSCSIPQGVRAGPQSAHIAWQFGTLPPTAKVKHESMDEDRNNDSGINSGSDFHSSSPGSDSQDIHHPYGQSVNTVPRYFHGNPLLNAGMMHQYLQEHHSNYTPQSPLTPPHSEQSLVSPKSEKDTTTPCISPNAATTAPTSNSQPTNNDSDGLSNDGEDFETQLKVPRMNSHGKVKTMKCKQCEFVGITKEDFWKHAATHIKEEKRLTCPKCPFVTEYKHHLEYHLRNHTGSKPFKCDQCNYSCVNKSMLNSHMKSHSNVYQYHCSDCNYATKYCHSLKLHLRKYKHSPGKVLNIDGSVNPLPIIDVYGTRRGPKSKPSSAVTANDSRLLPPSQQELLPFPLNHLMGQPQQFQFPYHFLNGLPQPNPELLRNFQQIMLQQERLALAAAAQQNNGGKEDGDDDDDDDDDSMEDHEVLDLSKPDGDQNHRNNHRRKGPPFKLNDLVTVNESEEDDDCSNSLKTSSKGETNNNGELDTCQYCDITFGDTVLYTIHMGYHGFKNPFTCNMCGVECADKVAFFLHIARISHS